MTKQDLITGNGIDPERVQALTIGLVLECAGFGDRRQGDLSKVETDAEKAQLGLEKHLVPRGRTLKEFPADAAAGAKALRKVEALFRQAQIFCRETVGLPSGLMAGVHRIPVACVPETNAELRRIRDEALPEAVAEFAAAYPRMRDAMRPVLGSQWREQDWPEAGEVASRFFLRWQWFEIDGVPPRLDGIDQVAAAEARAEQHAHAREIAEECRAALVAAARDLVKEIGRRLSGDPASPKKFRQSTIFADMNEFLRTFPMRNVTDHKALAEAMADLRAITEGLDLDALKKDGALQATLKAEVGKIAAGLDALIVDADSRMIVLEDEERL